MTKKAAQSRLPEKAPVGRKASRSSLLRHVAPTESERAEDDVRARERVEAFEQAKNSSNIEAFMNQALSRRRFQSMRTSATTLRRGQTTALRRSLRSEPSRARGLLSATESRTTSRRSSDTPPELELQHWDFVWPSPALQVVQRTARASATSRLRPPCQNHRNTRSCSQVLLP